MRIVFAAGSAAYCSRLSCSAFSNLNLYVPSRPVVVVAAYEMFFFSRRGIRKVEVQPAPRMRISTVPD